MYQSTSQSIKQSNNQQSNDQTIKQSNNESVYITRIADLNWVAFMFPIYCPSGASRPMSRGRFLPAAGFYSGCSYLVLPATSVEAAREYEDALGSHRQVSLITIGRAGHRGSKRLLTPMIQVCFPSPHHQPAQKDLLPWQLFRRRFRLKVTYRDFVDRWLLDLIMSICGFRHARYPQSSVLTVDRCAGEEPRWLNHTTLAAHQTPSP